MLRSIHVWKKLPLSLRLSEYDASRCRANLQVKAPISYFFNLKKNIIFWQLSQTFWPLFYDLK